MKLKFKLLITAAISVQLTIGLNGHYSHAADKPEDAITQYLSVNSTDEVILTEKAKTLVNGLFGDVTVPSLEMIQRVGIVVETFKSIKPQANTNRHMEFLAAELTRDLLKKDPDLNVEKKALVNYLTKNFASTNEQKKAAITLAAELMRNARLQEYFSIAHHNSNASSGKQWSMPNEPLTSLRPYIDTQKILSDSPNFRSNSAQLASAILEYSYPETRVGRISSGLIKAIVYGLTTFAVIGVGAMIISAVAGTMDFVFTIGFGGGVRDMARHNFADKVSMWLPWVSGAVAVGGGIVGYHSTFKERVTDYGKPILAGEFTSASKCAQLFSPTGLVP